MMGFAGKGLGRCSWLVAAGREAKPLSRAPNSLDNKRGSGAQTALSASHVVIGAGADQYGVVREAMEDDRDDVD